MRRPFFLSLAWTALAAVAMVGSWASPASAQTPLQVLVVEGDVEALSPSERDALRKAIDAEVGARPRLAALPRPQATLIDLMFDAECLEPDAACLAAIGEGKSATHVFFYEAQAKGGAFSVPMRLVDVAQKTEAASTVAKGDQLSAALKAMGAAAEEVLGPKPAPKPKLVTLRIRSTPAAAVVKLDGKEVGTTPAEVRSPAGTYSLSVSKSGYETVERTVELRDKDVDFELKLTEKPEPAAAAAVVPPTTTGTGTGTGEDGDETPYYETWWFWTVVGVGVVGAGVGIAAAAGAFDAEETPTGGLSFQLGSRPDQDVLLRNQFR